jgi:hypothetical protein
LASPGLDELPHRSQKKAVDFVDNSLAKGRQRTGALAVDKSQNRDLSTARPFAHKLHSLIMIFFIPQKQNIQGLGRGWGKSTWRRSYPIPIPAFPLKGKE